MEIPQKKPAPVNKDKYGKDEYELALQFAKNAVKEFSPLIKAIVIFGHSVKKITRPEPVADIDILVILDDVGVDLNPEVVEAYRILVQKIILKVSKRLHITTLRLTSFWEYVRQGDPVAVNILRDGVALIDVGFFDPLQRLLFQGRIRPTLESTYVYYNRAPVTLKNSEWHILQAVIDLYWAVIDSAHAALMKYGEIPVAPEEVANLMEEVLVKKKICDKKYPNVMRHFYELSKNISHKKIASMKGYEYDNLKKEAEEFVKEMGKIVHGNK